MRPTATMLCLLGLLAACGEEGPPECTEAADNYYGEGCSFFDLETGNEIPGNEFVLACRELRGLASETRCEDEMDELLYCLDSVNSQADCGDCNSDLERLLACRP